MGKTGQKKSDKPPAQLGWWTKKCPYPDRGVKNVKTQSKISTLNKKKIRRSKKKKWGGERVGPKKSCQSNPRPTHKWGGWGGSGPVLLVWGT